MNCLNIDPNNLINKIENCNRDFKYNFLDHLLILNVPIKIYYQILINIESFKLKNIWNHIIIRWNLMKKELRNNKQFKNTKYFNESYNQKHFEINDELLNKYLNDFINNDILKCLFVCNCIQNYIY